MINSISSSKFIGVLAKKIQKVMFKDKLTAMYEVHNVHLKLKLGTISVRIQGQKNYNTDFYIAFFSHCITSPPQSTLFLSTFQ